MTEDEYGNKVWTFRPARKIAGLSQISLAEKGDCRLEDGTFRCCGHITPEPLEAVIWGGKAELSLSVVLFETPEDALPSPLESASAKRGKRKLSPELQARVNELNAKIRELKARLPTPPDEALERRYLDYVDSGRLKEAFQRLGAIWNDPEREMTLKCREAGECLEELHDILTPMRLPDELLRDDTRFALVPLKALQFARTIEESAGKRGTDFPEKARELIAFLDDLTDRMIEGGNALYGLERSMTREEIDAYLDLELDAMHSDKPVEERLDMLRQLWENSLIPPNDRIKYLKKAVELTRKRGRKSPESCPDKELIKRHLEEIGCCLRKLEEEGAQTWRSRMAAELFDSAAAWREGSGMPALSREEFAAGISLRSAVLETEERKTGDIRVKLELFFEDGSDSFAGHFLYARVENGEVGEITLMG